MTLRIFNPDHDLALASGLQNFTPPHAGRQLRHDLGWLPALWAADSDGIVVDDAEQATMQWNRMKAKMVAIRGMGLPMPQPQFLTWRQPLVSKSVDAIDPWGWNMPLRRQLLASGMKMSLLPDNSRLSTVRELSHRRHGAALLPHLRVEGTVGVAYQCSDMNDLQRLAKFYGQVVLKAPWSSSGRGLRFINMATDHGQKTDNDSRWAANIIAAQGSVMVEPFYNKVKDFGMEFYSDGQGSVSYLGLSLFHTENGAYKGNILATEEAKTAMLRRLLSEELLERVRQAICQQLATAFKNRYRGPFGIDMMAVTATTEGTALLHPCVEINLRRTMGHAALAATRLINPENDSELICAMQIDYTDHNYKLHIKRL